MFWNKKKKTEDLVESNKAQSTPSVNENKKMPSLSNSQRVEAFILEFENELKAIHDLAKSTIEQWKAHLIKIEVPLVSQAHREAAKASGLPMPKIAFPSEFREAIFVVREQFEPRLEKLELSVKDDFEADGLIKEFVRRRLSSIIDVELSKYLDASKPAVSVADMFANASTSINKYSTTEEGDKSYSIKCKTCGAARLKEYQQDNCFYCGTPLF